MDLKKLSELKYWQWFGISFVGIAVLSSHSLTQVSALSAEALLVISSIYIVMSGILAFILKRYYSKNRIAKIFSKNPFKKLTESGFQVHDGYVKGIVNGYHCRAGLSFSELHMTEFVWFEIYFINPSKDKDDWNERYKRLKNMSSRKSEWKYNSIRKSFGVIVRRISYDNLMKEIRKTIEILQSANLKAGV